MSPQAVQTPVLEAHVLQSDPAVTAQQKLFLQEPLTQLPPAMHTAPGASFVAHTPAELTKLLVVSPQALQAPVPVAHEAQLDPAVAVQQMEHAQAPLPHSEFALQLAPGGLAQVPLMHDPETQSPLAVQTCPTISFDLHTLAEVT